MYRVVTYNIKNGQYTPYFTSAWFADINDCWLMRGFCHENSKYFMIEQKKNIREIYTFTLLDCKGIAIYKSGGFTDLQTCYDYANVVSAAGDLFYTLEKVVSEPAQSHPSTGEGCAASK